MPKKHVWNPGRNIIWKGFKSPFSILGYTVEPWSLWAKACKPRTSDWLNENARRGISEWEEPIDGARDLWTKSCVQLMSAEPQHGLSQQDSQAKRPTHQSRPRPYSPLWVFPQQLLVPRELPAVMDSKWSPVLQHVWAFGLPRWLPGHRKRPSSWI